MVRSIILHRPGDIEEREYDGELLIVVENIENVQHSHDEDVIATSIVTTRDGKKYFVKESISEIQALINK